MQMKGIVGAALAGMLVVGSVYSQQTAAGEEAVPATGAEQVRQSLEKLLPGVTLDSIEESPVPGLYEVVVGPRVVYVSGDGRYLLQGSIIDVHTRTNITEVKQAEAKKAAMAQVSEDSMIVFSPKDYKHTMTVFTDIDCGYCRKLHQEMEDYNKEGIRVRYLFYPRAGVGSPSFQKAVNVWCAQDRHKAMTAAKAGEDVEVNNCENPVRTHLQLGEAMGVTGTPAIVLDSGEMLPGYIPAKRMGAYLNQRK